MSKHLKDTVAVCIMIQSQYCTEALKPTKPLNQDTWEPVQGSNLAPSNYKCKVLPVLGYITACLGCIMKSLYDASLC
jgi:hypothetical protein